MEERSNSNFPLKLLAAFCLVQALVQISLASDAAEPLDQDQRSSDDVVRQIEELASLPLEELQNVVITSIATKTRKPVAEVPAITSVVTAQDIAAMGATTFEEALQSIPGLHVFNAGQSSTPQYFIRGVSTFFNPQTLVMVNGVPINSLFRGDRIGRLSVLPVKLISRIEVIRGPGSALYGADAFAGVINVITKNASEVQGTELGGLIGSFDTRQAWFLHGETHGQLKATLMADYRETDGHRREITEDAQTSLDRRFGTDASLAPGPMNMMGKWLGLLVDLEKPKWRLRGSYQNLFGVGTGQGVGQALDPIGRGSRTRSLIELIHHDPEIGEGWDFTSRLSIYLGSQEIDVSLNLFPPGADLGQGVFPNGVIGNPEFWERQFRFDNSVLYSGIENHRMQVGAGIYLGDLYQVQESKNFTPNFTPLPALTDVTDTPAVYIPEASRNSFYVYTQDEWKVSSGWELTFGARYDHYSDFGGTLNPRAAVIWKTTPALTTKLLYGRAFRAPNFVELYTINNPVTLGNPELKPETINTYEIGWVYQNGPNRQTGLNLYHYDTEDLINFVEDPIGTATAQNSANQTGNGLEVETRLQIKESRLLTGNYSYVKATENKSEKPVGNYPDHRIYLRDDWSILPTWVLGTQVNFVGALKRQPTDPRGPLKGYTTVDLILRRMKLFEKLNLRFAIRNVFDADVRDPSSGPGPNSTTVAIPNDLPQARRNAFVDVTYLF